VDNLCIHAQKIEDETDAWVKTADPRTNELVNSEKVQELEAQAGRREYGQQPSAQIQKLLQDLHDRMMELQCLPDLRQRHGDAIYPQWV